MPSSSAIASRTFAYILAGGQGRRLHPLTLTRAKPAVPFGGMYRLIDFTLSNLFNSGVGQIRILTQYQCRSVRSYTQAIFHSGAENGFTSPVCLCPQEGRTYAGTADAVFQNLVVLKDKRADLVLILSADHVYRMDYRDLIRFHLECGRDATIAAVECPVTAGSEFGVLEVDSEHHVVGFEEKPNEPKAIPGKPSKSLVNMGVYIFNRQTLFEILTEDSHRDTRHDFGRDILPDLVQRKRLAVYNFTEMGTRLGSYWRDVGTVDAYYQANMEFPLSHFFDVYDRAIWPLQARNSFSIYSGPRKGHSLGLVRDSVISPGVSIGLGARIVHSVLSPGVQIGPRAEIRNSVLLHNVSVGAGVRLQGAILDENAHIRDGLQIGFDVATDRQHGLVTDTGIVVLSSTFETSAEFTVENSTGTVRDSRTRIHGSGASI